MTHADTESLEGKTLNVYSYAVKEGKPVGPREVMRANNLSSPSVAYWHLQKLEACGLLEKNGYGEYIVKEKVNISGHLWIGRNLVPRLMCYSLFFSGVVGTELVIIASQFFLHGVLPSIDLIYLAATNAIATVLFLSEGLQLRRKNKLETHKNTDHQKQQATKNPQPPTSS
ncbi:MAG: hypothetical protein NWF04_02465 [Candidatus Bathyarchaeota archaeon]|nr:hypothetical protein [Candidatus Bathyarchaeota archaeon]